MPTYDYVCDACGHKFEQYQSIKDDALTKCPECGKKKLRRLIGTGAAIMFKGSGFYQTDYRSDSYKKSAAADKPPSETKPSESKGTESKSTESKSSDSKSSESKPAESKETQSKPAEKGSSESGGRGRSKGRKGSD